MLYSTDRKRGVSLIFVNHQFFGNLLKKWIDKVRMYTKDGTRLQNKGVNLIVCLIFWTLRWFILRHTHLTVDLFTTHSPHRLQCHRFRPEDRSTSPFQAILSYYDDWNVPWTAQKSLTYLLFSYQSVWNACYLNIAPKGCVSWGGKNADLIGKEPLWIYTVMYVLEKFSLYPAILELVSLSHVIWYCEYMLWHRIMLFLCSSVRKCSTKCWHS
jgi:hypothetical protein